MSSKTEKFVLYSVQGTLEILLRVHNSKASATDHIFCIHQILEKNGNTMKQFISCLDLKNAHDSVRREVL
jgi:hypothetical protein